MARDAEQLEQLTAYLDGELSPGQRAEVDRLLAEDPGARALLDELRQTSQLVSALPREPAPAGLADAVVHRMERRDLLGESPPHPTSHSRVVSWSRRFAVAASIALVGTAVWIAWPHFTQLMTTEKQPIRLAQMDKSAETLTAPPLEERGRSEIGETKSLRQSASPAIGEALAERTVRSKAPLALGYTGDDADEEEAAAQDEALGTMAKTASQEPQSNGAPPVNAGAKPQRLKTIGTSLENFIAKLESRDADQPVARAATAPEPVQSVIVETDAATITRLTDLVEQDMARHAVPMLQADAQELIARRDDAFFTLRREAQSSQAPSSAGARPRADTSVNEVHIVLRVPQDVAAQLLTDMQRINEEAGTYAGWTTVGRPFDRPRAAGRASSRTEERDLPAGAEEHVENDALPASDRLEKKRSVSPAEQDAADSNDVGLFDEQRSPAQKVDRNRSISTFAASQPALVPDQPPGRSLVTLTIHLRTRPAISAPQTTQPSTQPAGLPTSRAAPRPTTTQEAPGG